MRYIFGFVHGTGAVKMIRWDTWTPSDPATLAEIEECEEAKEEINSKAFEESNPEFCEKMVDDMKARAQARQAHYSIVDHTARLFSLPACLTDCLSYFCIWKFLVISFGLPGEVNCIYFCSCLLLFDA